MLSVIKIKENRIKRKDRLSKNQAKYDEVFLTWQICP
jgi:hypothetical protein